MRIIPFIFFILATTLVPAQEIANGQPAVEDSLYKQENVEKQAEYPGGMEAMRKFIVQTLRYPGDAVEKNIQGKVYVEFIIDKTGKITEAKVIKGVFESLDKEALRIIESMPDWKPAEHKGKVVRQQYIFPLNFRLK